MATETRRVLADIRRENGETQLWFAGRQLSLEKLAPQARASLASLPTTIVIEADVQEQLVVALGDTRAHPRTAALRAIADLRYGHAREYLAQLGEAVETDIELLLAKLSLDRVDQNAPAAAASLQRLLALPGLTLQQAQTAYETLWAELRTQCAPAFVAFAEGLPAFPPRGLSRLLHEVPPAHWGPRLPLLGIEDCLAETPLERWDLERAEEILTAIKGTAPEAGLARASEQLAKGRERYRKREEKKQRALLASRPSFDEVEALFGRKLPPALRSAWEAHYAGDTVGAGFIEVKKGKVEKLAALAKKLERSLEAGERHQLTPHQLLPFGIGEHDGDYFALDLAVASGDDFAVRGVFNNGTGGNVLAYETSKAWLEADGLPKY